MLVGSYVTQTVATRMTEKHIPVGLRATPAYAGKIAQAKQWMQARHVQKKATRTVRALLRRKRVQVEKNCTAAYVTMRVHRGGLDLLCADAALRMDIHGGQLVAMDQRKTQLHFWE
jgi:hypothetical protein